MSCSSWRGRLPGRRGSFLSSLRQRRRPTVNRAITGAELSARIARGETLRILDVRSEGEFAAGHVPGALNIPVTRLLSRRDDLPGTPGDQLILYCGHGPRAHIAATALRCRGRTRIVYLRGHWAAWQAAGLPVER